MRDHSGSRENVTIGTGVRDKASWKAHWRIEKRKGDWTGEDIDNGLAPAPYEVLDVPGNILLNAGITELLELLTGTGSTAAYNSSNAHIVVGNGGLTSLSGTSTFTLGSAAVTGSSTAYTTEVDPKDRIQLNADALLYEVLSVESNTALTLKYLYAGTGGSGASSLLSPSETDMAGGSTAVKAMDGSYPQVSAQTASWRATYGSSEANFAWSEVGVKNGAGAVSGSVIMLNRRVQTFGTKASGSSWTITLEITIS